MKVTVNINGKDTEIELTADQVQKVKKATEKITDRIKNFTDVLQALPEKRRDEWAAACANLDEQGIANEKVKLIAEVLNEGWVAEPFNEDQWKYYPYFMVDNGAFVYLDYHYWRSLTHVGSRLCFKSSELAQYAGKTFIDIYTKLLS
jgi:hypothetical protein